MKTIITEQSFYKYLKCPSWLAREKAHGKDVREKLREKLQDDGLLYSKQKELLKDREYSEITENDIDEASIRTIELMTQGVEVIFGGTLVHGNWVGRPDLLEKVEGKSKFGDWYYVAVDMKRSSHLKDEYKFQGMFYGKILEKLQGILPVNGYVFHANGKVEGYLLEEFYTKFHLTLDAIEDILNNNVETHFLTSGCKQSPYFSECVSDSTNCDDLSLLNRIWRSEVDLLQKSNINTVSELADFPSKDLNNISGMSLDRLYFLQQQAIALVDKKIIKMGEVDLPDEPGVALVIDIESDPMLDLDYLFGVLVVDGENETYYPFLAKNEEEEEGAWKEFTEFLLDYSGANIYHYGWYEVDVFRRMVEKYSAPDEVQKMFKENMIDLLTRLRNKVIFPLSFYSLKDIAKYLGFNWRIKDASGADSVLWYEAWLEEGDETVLQDIVDYNEDDVVATWHVIKWVKGKI